VSTCRDFGVVGPKGGGRSRKTWGVSGETAVFEPQSGMGTGQDKVEGHISSQP